MKVSLTTSEKKILAKIRRYVGDSRRKYDFWFVYDEQGTAISWEGGFELGQFGKFRNQFTIEKGKQIVKNWD